MTEIQFGCGDYLPGAYDGRVQPPPPGPGVNEPGGGNTSIDGDFEPGTPIDPDGGGDPGVPPTPGPPTITPGDGGGGAGGGAPAPGVPGSPILAGGGGGAGPFTPPGGVAQGTNFGGFGGGAGPFDDPTGTANGGLFGGGLGGGNSADPFDPPDGVAGGVAVATGGATPFDEPGGTAGGVLVDPGSGGATPIDPPGGVAGGGLLDSGSNGANPFDAPDGTAGGVIFDPGGGFTPPDAAGGLGGFDIDGPAPPGNLGGFQTGIDTGTNTGGGGANPFDGPDNTAGAGLLDSGEDGAGNSTGVKLDGDFLSDSPTVTQEFVGRISNNQQFSILDSDISVRGGRTFSNRFVVNNSGNKQIFADKIHEGLDYILRYNNKFASWSANAVHSLRPQDIIKSFNPRLVKALRAIRKIDGSSFTDQELISLIMSRVLRGEESDLDVSRITQLALKTAGRGSRRIIPSSSQATNEAVALQLINKNKYPLDTTTVDPLLTNKSLVDNYKTFATDLGKYLPIVASGVEYKYYINDDDTFIDRTTLGIEDGDFFLCRKEGGFTRLPIESEKDHAFIIDEPTRQNALKLMGGDPARILSVSANVSSNIEFDYSLSSPRLNAYILKIDPSTAVTTSKSSFVKETSVRYELMDSSSNAGIREINNYIRYKSNYQLFTLADDDVLLDYIESTSELTMTQQDIVFDSAKTNKNTPILVRQIPWYIVIMPTNRTELLTFGNKSRVVNFSSDDIVTREIDMIPAIDPTITEKKYQNYVGTPNAFSEDIRDVHGKYNTQAVIKVFNPKDSIFSQNYVRKDENLNTVYSSATESKPRRRKTTFRIMKEILDEFNNNYVIDDEGSEIGVNSFDVVSRLSMTEFNQFMTLENAQVILGRLKEGVFNGIRIYPAVARSGAQAGKKTRLVQRRARATADRFPSIRQKNNGEYIQPPGPEPRSSTFSVQPLDDFIAKCTESRGIEPFEP
jgi:hypothetical protein